MESCFCFSSIIELFYGEARNFMDEKRGQATFFAGKRGLLLGQRIRARARGHKKGTVPFLPEAARVKGYFLPLRVRNPGCMRIAEYRIESVQVMGK